MLHQLTLILENTATELISTLGHWGIFIAMMIESMCIPLPSEVIMLFGGFLAAKGTLHFWLVIMAGVLGNLAGSIFAYWAGKYGGRRFIVRYGKYILFQYKHLEQADYWFQKYGSWATFFGRMMPFIRTFISLPAGITKMDVQKFIFFTFLGCVPWNIGLTLIGFKLGKHWEMAQSYIRPVGYAALFIALALIVRFLYKNIWKKDICKQDPPTLE
jgi:membrane protein DedA with SNARE-associated domain